MAEDLKAAIKHVQDTAAAAVIKPIAIPEATYPAVVVPEGHKVVFLEQAVYNEHRQAPERKTGNIHVQQVASLLEYWSLYADEDSRAFADPATVSVLAILDYHHSSAERTARWRQHRCTLTLTKTDEWQTWKKLDGKPQTQADFADFLEDNAPDIVEPNAATFVEAARDLRAKSEVNFQSAQVAKDGSINFAYQEETKGSFGKANMEIPERFTIAVPVFDGMDKVRIQARLRYRINQGKLTMWYSLFRAEYHEREAFQAVVDQIQEKTGRHVFIGKP